MQWKTNTILSMSYRIFLTIMRKCASVSELKFYSTIYCILYMCFFRDVDKCDRHGRNALHLVASSESIHARKMVSLLLKNGSNIGEDAPAYSIVNELILMA